MDGPTIWLLTLFVPAGLIALGGSEARINRLLLYFVVDLLLFAVIVPYL